MSRRGREMTPPPWTVRMDRDDFGGYHIKEAAWEQEDWFDEMMDEGEAERRLGVVIAHDAANRDLIELAPRMLEACRAVVAARVPYIAWEKGDLAAAAQLCQSVVDDFEKGGETDVR